MQEGGMTSLKLTKNKVKNQFREIEIFKTQVQLDRGSNWPSLCNSTARKIATNHWNLTLFQLHLASVKKKSAFKMQSPLLVFRMTKRMLSIAEETNN